MFSMLTGSALLWQNEIKQDLSLQQSLKKGGGIRFKRLFQLR